MPFIKGHPNYSTYKFPKGNIPWNKGKKGIMRAWNKGKKMSVCSEETRKKMSESLKRAWAEGRMQGMKGKKHSLERNEKMRVLMTKRKNIWGDKVSKSKKGKPNFKQRGENNNLWKGGISKINKTIRQVIMGSIEYKNWRRAVFKRDTYTCVNCGKRSGNGQAIILHADHIKPFALFPELRFAIDNGRTLCILCHKNSGTWGNLKNYV